MALPRILLIDDNKSRVLELETIFQFIDYRIEISGSEEYQSSDSKIGQLAAIFVGDGIDKQATVINQVIDWGKDTPVILLINKGTLSQVSSLIVQSVFYVLEWPTSYTVLKALLHRLPIGDAQAGIYSPEVIDRRKSHIQ